MTELTGRSFVVGCAIGALLGAGNVYMGLKTGVTESGNITATLLAFALLSRRGAARPLGPAEHNIAQSVAVVAAGMATTGALVTVAPALELSGHPLPAWGLVLWGIAVGTLGVLIASSLRRRLLVEARLPFPSGIATAELIRTLQTSRESAGPRLRALAAGSGLSALYVWFRDGRPAVLPAQLVFPGNVGGVPAASLTLGLACSPMLLGVGALIGLRASLSMVGGALVAWGGLGSFLVQHQLVSSADYSPLVSWLVWPGAGMILGASLTSLFHQRASMLKGARDLFAALRSKSALSDATNESLPRNVVLSLLGASVAAIVALGFFLFGAQPVAMLVALGLSAVLAGVCARSAGQTDIAPIGAMGQLGQVALTAVAPGQLSTNLGGGAVVAGVAGQVANSLWGLKTGEVLGVSLRPQLWAQLGAAWFGALACVPVYQLLVWSGGLGTPSLPAPAAAMTRALAEALTLQGKGLPQYALIAAGVGVAVGALMQQLSRLRFAPIPFAVGVGFVAPASFAIALCLGALLAWGAGLRWPQRTETLGVVVATGAIAGEAILGVVIALLTVAAIL